MKTEYNSVGPHAATICCCINANLVGMSLLKIGVKGDVPTGAFKLLCLAFESYIWIWQINSHKGKITYKKLALRINTVMRHNYWQEMLQRVLLARTKDLDASTMHIAKDW